MSDQVAVAGALEAGERFRMGRIIGRTFSAVASNGLMIWPLAFLFVALPASGMGYLTFLQQDGRLGGILRNGVVGLFAIYVQGVVIKACLDKFAGKPNRVGRSLGAGASNYAAMFGIRWLANIGTILGLILLVVPGLIWATSWTVASAVLIANDTGSQGPLARSAKLTKGYRWPVFGLLLLFFVAYIVLSASFGSLYLLAWPWIAPLVPGIPTVSSALDVGTTPIPSLLLDVFATPIPLMLYEVFAAAGAASIYWELKLVRESGGAEVVSRVFA